MTPVFFHVDMDAFYAAIEQLDHPALRGRPVLVGGRSGRGVVAACSYEARRFGVHSAMPVGEALRKCPEAAIVPVRMERYRELSRTIRTVLDHYSPVVEMISIDEGFLDMTGSQRLMGAPRDVARELKQEVRETTQLTISVGIGSSRFIAKLASDIDKPDGLHEVPPGTEAAFVQSLPLGKLWGLGKSTLRRLQMLGITTTAELAAQRPEVLRGHFGQSTGSFLHCVARGEDPGVGLRRGQGHSISAEQTFEHDIRDAGELRRVILEMAEEVIHRSLQEQWRGRTVQVKYRFPPFETHTASRTLDHPPAGTRELATVAMGLLEGHRGGRPLRLLGVGISGTAGNDGTASQGQLFDLTHREDRLDPTILALRQRFGAGAITRAHRLGNPGESPEGTEQ